MCDVVRPHYAHGLLGLVVASGHQHWTRILPVERGWVQGARAIRHRAHARHRRSRCAGAETARAFGDVLSSANGVIQHFLSDVMLGTATIAFITAPEGG